MSEPTQKDNISNADTLQEFQIAELSIKDKSSPEYGKKLSKKIWGQVIQNGRALFE